jgi:hypothetical protein
MHTGIGAETPESPGSSPGPGSARRLIGEKWSRGKREMRTAASVTPNSVQRLSASTNRCDQWPVRNAFQVYGTKLRSQLGGPSRVLTHLKYVLRLEINDFPICVFWVLLFERPDDVEPYGVRAPGRNFGVSKQYRIDFLTSPLK